MKECFPTTFSQELTPVNELALDEHGRQVCEELREKGFVVVSGARRSDVPGFTRIASQRRVREYCPKDLAERFGNEQQMTAWFQKDGGAGRGALQLRPLGAELSTDPDDVKGAGWVGPKRSALLPNCVATFALRLSEEVPPRQRIGMLFTQLMLAAAIAQYEGVNYPEDIGLDTWQSNISAVVTYGNAGATLVHAEPNIKRPTLGFEPEEKPGEVIDTRLHMQFTSRPWELARA